MIKLIIDGKEAVIKAGTSFKLTRMNPYFEDQGDFTFEVQLPLDGCAENLAIFGALHRAEVGKVGLIGKKYDMQLIAPPVDVHGYAQITHITDAEVKVQLVAGRSSFSHAIEDTAVYVDEMDLGNAWDIFPAFTDGEDSWKPGYNIEHQTSIFYYSIHDIHNKVDVGKMMHGRYRETDCVCFPVYSITDDKFVNPHTTRIGDSYSGAGTRQKYRLAGYGETDETYAKLNETLLAPQPYLLDIIGRVVKAAGYVMGDIQELEESWMSGIFIANTRSVLRRNAALPHWTLSEFIKELQNFWGVVFVVDGQKRVHIRTRSSWYSDTHAAQYLKEVTDDLSTDIDHDGSNKGSSAGNVDYEWPNSDNMLHLPDEVWENAIIVRCANFASIQSSFNALKPSERERSQYLYIDQEKNYVYAILHKVEDQRTTYVLQRVDQYGALIRKKDKREIDTKLKIVPARMKVMNETRYYSENNPPSLWVEGRIETGLPVLSVADTALTTLNYYSVDNAINPKEDDVQKNTDQRKDVLEVAYFSGDTFYDGDTEMPVPIAVPFITNPKNGFPECPTKLIDISGRIPEDGVFTLQYARQQSIGEGLNNGAAVNTGVEHLFCFTDAISCDPTEVYVIRGRRYACHKLEFTIDEFGVQPLKRGYFYEIE